MAISPQGMVNLAYWNVLPMGISNYGGDIQVYNVGEYAKPFFTSFNPLAMQNLSTPFMDFGCQIQIPQPSFGVDFMA